MMTDAPSLSSFTLDDRFDLGDLIGRGGMADVYEARDRRHDRTVAVKVLRSDVLESIGADRFRREIALTASFSHPHILALLESGDTTLPDGRRVVYYVMPLVPGKSLRDRLVSEDHLSVAESVRITREVLAALRYAHAAGVVHRDIKPANILILDGLAVVADFGIARPVAHAASGSDHTTSLTVSGIAVGTPAYMSPEQAFGDRSVDGRSDLYAVGCVLYEMLTGRPPFEANTGQGVIARKINGAFVAPSATRPSLPSVLDEIVARALQPDPTDRYPSAAEFLAALEQPGDATWSALHLSRVTAAAPVVVPRRRWGWAALLLPLLAGVWLLRSRDQGNAPGAATDADPARVAVLPFDVLSVDTSLTLVANGLTSDLIDALAQVEALSVVSRNGTAAFAGKAVGTDSVARVLHVGSVVTGSVRRDGERVRVVVRLVDGLSGQQLASRDTAASIDSVLGVRSVVIDEVARFLRSRLGEQVRLASARAKARNAQAWSLVEQVRALRSGELSRGAALRVEERQRRFAFADSLATRAAELDKSWPEPLVQRALLALQYATLEQFAVTSDRAASVARRDSLWLSGLRWCEAALRRDPNDANAFRVRGAILGRQWRASASADSLRVLAEASLRAAVDRQPKMADAWEALSSLLYDAGDFVEAGRAAESALRADEFLASAPLVMIRLQESALGAERRDEATRWCDEGRRRYPADIKFAFCELVTLGWAGSERADVGRAWQVLDRAERLDSLGVASQSGWALRRLLIAALAARAGLPDSARAILLSVQRAMADSTEAVAARMRAGQTAGATQLNADLAEAYVYATLNDRAAANARLQAYLKRAPTYRRQTARMPWFKGMRADPEFLALTTTP